LLPDSFVIRNISRISNYLLCSFKQSVLYIVLKGITDWLRWLFKTCVSLELIKRESISKKAWANSKTRAFFARILILVTNFTRRKYERQKLVFANSHVFKLVELFANNLHILTATALFVLLITPHSFWYNIFTTMITPLPILFPGSIITLAPIQVSSPI
jgi:hypothetical protein